MKYSLNELLPETAAERLSASAMAGEKGIDCDPEKVLNADADKCHPVAPAEIDRGNRGRRGTAQNKAPKRPGDPGQSRDSRGKVGRHFELRMGWQDKQPPGVFWIGHARGNDLGELAPPEWICDPLKIEAATRDDQGGEWGRLLVFTDADGHEKRWAMPMRMLAAGGEELRSELLASGLRISTNPQARQRLGDYISREHPASKARCVSRTGWQGEAFVLPRETLGDTEAERVIYQSNSLEGIALGQAGTLDGWITNVCMPSAGNPLLVLAIAAGFAAPCLGLLGAEGGGIHYRGGSSTGKTTALQVAASMYGSPAYLRAWRATDNGLEGIAALHSDLLLVLDEIGQLDPKHAGQVAYLLANGQGKGRAHRDGSPRAINTWRTLFLSAGEVGLGDLVTEAGGKVRAGQEVRVLDIPADAGAGLGLFERVPAGMTPGVFADSLKRGVAHHYGHAAPAFVRMLVAAPAKSRHALRAVADALAAELVKPDANGQVSRVAARFALIGAAGELATAWGLTGWPTGEAENAARTCFKAWLQSRGTTGAAEPAAMLRQVRAFLEAHSEARFTPWPADEHAPRTINRAGYRRDTRDGPEYFIEREAFRTEVCKGFDHAAVARMLIKRGALTAGSCGETTRKERLPDGRSARVYRILPALWEHPDD